MREVSEYRDMCKSCQQFYRDQQSGESVFDYLIICTHELPYDPEKVYSKYRPIKEDK